MSKFNKKVTTTINSRPATINHAGGKGYALSEKEELTGILLNSFVNDTYYRSTTDILSRTEKLLKLVPVEFAAKLALYARNKYGMRSISHYFGALIALDPRIKGQEWAKQFFNSLIYRIDDMSEILAVIWEKQKNHKIPNPVKKGFRDAFAKFDDYQISKYKMEGKDIKLVDLVNLLHPVPYLHNEKSLRGLINDELVNQTTSGNVLSAIGQATQDEDEKNQLRQVYWKNVVEQGKLGMTDLVRSLTKIINESDSETVNSVVKVLENKEKISKGKVFPFQLFQAQHMVNNNSTNAKEKNKISSALEVAMRNCVGNIPEYEGNSCVIIDHSGSMDHHVKSSPVEGFSPSMYQVAMIFGISLSRKIGADTVIFGDYAKYYNINVNDSLQSIMQNAPFLQHGTNIASAFDVLKKKYDRIFVFTDLGHNGYNDTQVAAQKYIKDNKADPHIFYFDLAGNNAIPSNNKKTYYLPGVSDKVFELVPKYEIDKNALINDIEDVSFEPTNKHKLIKGAPKVIKPKIEKSSKKSAKVVAKVVEPVDTKTVAKKSLRNRKKVINS